MYAKIFTQIFDSSIAEDYQVRHVFEDLLKLCDPEGVVDMTREAISRRTNVPLDIVNHGIDQLLKKDPRSRSKEFEGRRIIPIDQNREWGWMIVNYDYYRQLQDEESRRKTWRESKRRLREKEKLSKYPKIGKPISGELQHKRDYENGVVDENNQPIDQDSRL